MSACIRRADFGRISGSSACYRRRPALRAGLTAKRRVSSIPRQSDRVAQANAPHAGSIEGVPGGRPQAVAAAPRTSETRSGRTPSDSTNFAFSGFCTIACERERRMAQPSAAQLLADLGVTRSLSRSQVSDDNPFSEAQFKTLKYHPGFPRRFDDSGFACFAAATIAFCRSFFPWYNTEHRHAGIAMLTPHDVHYGRARRVLEQRERTLRLAWSRHPERFVNGTPKPQPLPQGLNQPARRGYDATACSVTPNRRCLNVVDRFPAAAERIGVAIARALGGREAGSSD